MLKSVEHALELHQNGQINEALESYENYLSSFPDDSVALYGVASIYLSQGNIQGYELSRRAIFGPHDGRLDLPLAASSIVRLLLQQQYKEHAKKFLEDCQIHQIYVADQVELLELIKIPSYLQKTVYDHQLQQTLERYRPMESAQYVYAIDIVGGCNLRCPTCPVGNSDSMPKGLMTIDLYQKILAKIQNESVDLSPDIWLFNWTEPLLHPQVAEFVALTNSIGFSSFISSNLNMGERIESVMRAQPSRLKVSLSSLNQEIYKQTHVRGDINEVIKNLNQLARWRDCYKSKTQIWIGHHLYKNTIDEQQEIESLAFDLGFGYVASPAILAPIEAVMTLMSGSVKPDIEKIRSQFLHDPLKIRESISLRRSGTKDCELRFNMTAIQYDGIVSLCCASTKSLTEPGIFFLDHSHQHIEALKYQHSFCKACMKSNLHLTMPDR